MPLTNIVTDTFIAADGTAVESRPADTGQTWTRGSVSDGGVSLTITSHKVDQPGGSHIEYVFTGGVSSTPDCRVTLNVDYQNTVSNRQVVVVARGNLAHTDLYYAAMDPWTGGKLEWGKLVGGVGTTFNSGLGSVLTNNTSHTFALDCTGTTLTLLLDGSTVDTVTDSSIAVVGLAAFGSQGDDFSAGFTPLVTQFTLDGTVGATSAPTLFHRSSIRRR